MATFVDDLEAGQGGLFVVEGESGLGKSSLLESLAACAAVVGLRLAHGQAAELDQSRPFGPLIAALDLRATSLDPDAAEIGRMLGQSPHGGLAQPIDAWQIADAILDHVENLASRGSVLVLVDDLQWADVSTLRTLSALAEQSAQLPLGIAVACRPTPRSPDGDRLLASWARRPNTTSVALEALATSDVTALLAALAGAPPGPTLSRLAERAGGNPLFVTQLVASMQDTSQLEVGTFAEATSDYVPVSLRVAIDRRVRALASSTQRLLRLASVLGTTFSLDQLATVSGGDVLDVAHQLRPAFDDGLLGDHGSAATRAVAGDLDTALELGRRGILLTGEAECFWGGFMYPHLYLAPALLAADRIDEARVGLQSGRTAALERNLRVAVPAYDGLLALCDFLEGRWDDAALASVEAGKHRIEAGLGHPRAPGRAVAALIAAARSERSSDAGDRPMDARTETDGNALLCIEYDDLAAASTVGTPGGTVTVLLPAWKARRPFHLPGYASTVGPELVRLALEAEDGNTAREVTEDLRALASRARTIRPLVAAALRVEGLVDESPEPLLAAVELMEDSPRVYERAAVLEDAGIVVASHDADRARTLLDRALDIYDALDARRDSARVVDRMRATGLRPRRRRASRPRFGWEALTPTELRVVDEVAQGRTNGEAAAAMYISRHTVESHLKHIFVKLGARSRADVAAQGALHRS